ncbi:hypothetical protein SISNIDRAFT_546672 [Sistotremastrum niveocremeum HHB9708]|uniref:STB6-like N-terminal domain-containing protein n=1 Tax=Sistotremastrum niveocremeum HHB9708 TaxID=1314777 RepID=A0A164Z5T8_9AGAM|nr:hypothetical protein SISNIDRAFT_546672 [Sistotremastrum niveocremeum HHB9708]
MYSSSSRRLIIPTTHHYEPAPSQPVSPPRHRHTNVTARLTKSPRSDSLASTPTIHRPPHIWWSDLGSFHLVTQTQISGYQLYAVEKWVVERTRFVTTLAVATGDSQHKISVTILEPSHGLSESEAQAEFDNAVRSLKRDGARPKETSMGTLMVTSLANFRSDFTIVQIPTGDFLASRERLYANINLSRMGCSGRSALTLEEPNEVTLTRFMSTYHFPHVPREGSCQDSLTVSVLGLIQLLQTALSLFGMFEIGRSQRNGLLCDVTVKGLERWTVEIGEATLSLEPMERVADPTVVAALLSIVATTRNKLAAIGTPHGVPHDPFLHPQALLRSLAHFVHSSRGASSVSLSLQPSASSSHHLPGYLTLSTLRLIDAAYQKVKPSETYYKVHRVIMHKLDDLSRDFRSGSPAVPIYATSDLATLVNIVIGDSKGAVDGAASIKALWLGKSQTALQEARERSKHDTDGDLSDRTSDDDDREPRSRFSPSRRQRAMDNWRSWDFTILPTSRSKKSIDITSRDLSPSDITRDGSSAFSKSNTLLPSATVAGDSEVYDTTSGPESPIQGQITRAYGSVSRPGNGSGSERDQKTAKPDHFPRRIRPIGIYPSPRLTSWADPFSANDTGKREGRDRLVSLRSRPGTPSEFESDESEVEIVDRDKLLARRHSFTDLQSIRGTRLLPLEYMKIDADLCGELLVMRMRERHLSNVMQLLETVERVQSARNADLFHEQSRNQPLLSQIQDKRKIIQAVEQLRDDSARVEKQVNTVHYQSKQIQPFKLWQNVKLLRQWVATQRSHIYKTVRELPGSGHGESSNSTISHVYPYLEETMPGGYVRVDGRGRTEEEFLEEMGVAEAREDLEREDQNMVGINFDDVSVVEVTKGWAERLLEIGKGFNLGRTASVAGNTKEVKPPPDIAEKNRTA